ncbi:hypothetical protein CPT_Mater231 [Bacillus phage Mater]|uniref:Uncharacterized protein n=1 Tax=Bacillus phage Mater TaxID=1540090 RepID=A0A0A0RUX3_9CAUD|nr:hypothetical protein CPT_Mater9 [Bacillus phage Mater]YP_009151190.1 hypothetical protein CPT_Mater231 [Bacillus phage Mater]AIW03166.1 hypothetical protein CPT_Mater9 [Bacillus phage Mater]AIW03388.1 hypothetical protein CPT_Mater231 [Bacillus phage Mater]
MKNVLTVVEMHRMLAPNHNVTIEFSGHETINIPRTTYIAQDMGYTEFGRCGYFIKDTYLQELNNAVCEAIQDYEGLEGLEYNWLDGTNEYVLNVGSVIIIDGLPTEEMAEGLYNLIAYDMEEVVYICNECDAVHEDETETCDLCGEEVRVVAKSDLDM